MRCGSTHGGLKSGDGTRPRCNYANVADLSDESFLAGLDFPDRAPIDRYWAEDSTGRHSKPPAHAHFGWLNVAFRFVARPTRS